MSENPGGLLSFERALREDVSRIASEEGVSTDHAFSIWYCEVALRLDRQEAVDASRFDGGNDRGVDIFYVDDELQRVVVAQTKYYRSTTKAPSPAELALLLDIPEALSDPQALRDDGRPDLAEAADDLAAAVDSGYAVRLQLVYPGSARKGLDQQIRTYNKRRVDQEMAAELVPLIELATLHSDYMGEAGRVGAGMLVLSGSSSYEQSGPYGRAMVASVTGDSLKRLYDEHGDALFDQNVRLFLGARKGSVNAGIRSTIDSPTDRGNFWAYNNGITIVARSYRRRVRAAKVELTQFSIVNGCQTTVLIGRSDAAAVQDVHVLARIVAAPAKVLDNIIKYTNSQTPIRVWEMSARDKEQQRIRRELEALPDPWFYAFRRGEYEAIGNKSKFGAGQDRRVLPFPQSIQYLAAFRGMPVQAYKDKGRLFTVHKDKVLPPGLHPTDLLWAWHVGEAVRGVIPAVAQQLTGDPDATLILRRGPHFYATAIAATLLADRNGQDFTARVEPRRLADKAMRDRLSKYATTALVYYVRATKQFLSGGKDLGLILRSPETNRELTAWVNEQMVTERLAPKALGERLPKLPNVR